MSYFALRVKTGLKRRTSYFKLRSEVNWAHPISQIFFFHIFRLKKNLIEAAMRVLFNKSEPKVVYRVEFVDYNNIFYKVSTNNLEAASINYK